MAPRKRNKAKKPTETMQQRQRRLLQEQRAAKAQAKPTPAKPKPAAKPPVKDGRQPRALTNTKSATMRQIRAKAVQARRQGQGKSTVASRQQGITPDSARGQRIKAMASRQRVMGDSGQVRAAQQRGKQEAAKAQTRRNARAAMSRMDQRLQQSRTARAIREGVGLVSRGGAAAAGLQAYNTADGTLTAAMKRGDYKPKQGPSPKTTQASFNKKTFDQAFKAARTSGAKTFTWRGKKYTTKMK
jgi:hypothetical protein